MPAYASIETTAAQGIADASFVGVYRYRSGGASMYEHLPHVRVLEIHLREGPDPGSARFRYVQDPAAPAGGPTAFEDYMSVDASGPGVVANDERLVVLAFAPDGDPEVLFDGFAQVPEVDYGPNTESVTFLAFGVGVRAWDAPVGGTLMRDADDPSRVSDVETDLIVRFNPDGRPNATPEGADAVGESGLAYPTFLDPLVIREPDLRRHWTLAMAIRYLCGRHNPTQEYVRNPNFDAMDGLLENRAPRPSSSFSPDDPGSYDGRALLVADYPATGKPWPEAIHDLLEPNGFGMAFRLEAGADGEPVTALEIFRRDDGTAGSSGDLFLQQRGEPLDTNRTNLGAARLARDTAGIANAFVVESGPVRYEATFVLAPGFPVAAGDAADASALKAFDRNAPEFSKANRDRYRLYVFDETGEGHWSWDAGEVAIDATSLAALFAEGRDDAPPHAKRRRPPLGELFSRDANRRPLKAQLSISRDYRGAQPGLWDGTGTWQPVLGGFELLKDRLGIWINAANPNGWNIGASRAAGTPYPAGVVRGVEDQAVSAGSRFVLRLTCVIEGDRALAATAGRRPSSPIGYTIARRVDARGRYARHVKAAGGEFNAGSASAVDRDDTDDALAEAQARRLASEAGRVAGTAVIPRLTTAYRLGDRVRSIQGRGLSLRTNAGAPSAEGEVFPAVVGLTWDLDGRRRTILHLSDHRGRHA